MVRWHVVFAVFGRNVKQYFSGPLGYLFIVVFVTVCSVMTFSPQFFADNLANLDQLTAALPMLLLFFVPAITMSAWADEKRQGTDSILFTLPASDFDILLGKYLSVVAVYTIALFFSLIQLFKLAQIGNPDWGVIATTYLGYWLAGLSLLSVGMFASSLTQSATIAFVVGALLCSIPVLIGNYFRGVIGLERLGFEWNLRDFTIGLIPLSSVAYFLALTCLMLYLNLIVISRRHWSRGQQLTKAPHFVIRIVCMAIALVSVGYLSNTALSTNWSRIDLTAEKLYALDPVTVATLQQVRDKDREVLIQAFVSNEVPRNYVNTKKHFVSLLRQFAEYGGSNVRLRLVEVEPNSDAAAEARVAGIEPRFDRSEVAGRVIEQDIYLGAKVSTSEGEVTMPFIGNEAAIEYELSRAVAYTIDKSQQISLGIVDTDTFFAGPLFDGRRVPWAYNATFNELKKQFRIVHIQQDELSNFIPKTESEETGDGAGESVLETANGLDENLSNEPKRTPPDVLIVADPSSLDEVAMEALVKYVKAGNPTLVLVDPLPFRWTYQHPTQIGVINAPRQNRISGRSPYSEVLTSSNLPKADGGRATRLLDAIGIQWDYDSAVWHLDNPFPNFRGIWPDYVETQLRSFYGPYDKAFVFVRDRSGHQAFDPASPISRGLQQLMFVYPGSIGRIADSPFQFQPLVTLSTDSGITPWDQLTMTPKQSTRSINPRTGEIRVDEQAASSQITMEDLVVLEPNPQVRLDPNEHVLAAHISSSADQGLNVVVIADLDFVSEVAYEQAEGLQVQFDNLALLTNAIEVLADNSDFVNLRNRRVRPRSLVKLEEVFDQFRRERTEQQQEAEKQMQEEMAAAQTKLDEATKDIQADESLSFIQKLQRSSQEATDAQRRFDMRKRKLEKDLEITIKQLQTEEQKRISKVESWTRYSAILTAPIPALILGFFVLGWRYYNEQRHISPQRKIDTTLSS